MTGATPVGAKFRFAGIGSRKATHDECRVLTDLCEQLVADGGWCYSGNAVGSDIACQRGAGKSSTAWLPSTRYNCHNYDVERQCGDSVVAGTGRKGQFVAAKLFKGWSSRTPEIQTYLTRDVYQVLGDLNHPPVNFVLCCASPITEDTVRGGTNYAATVANYYDIPVVNIRVPGWLDRLESITRSLTPPEQAVQDPQN